MPMQPDISAGGKEQEYFFGAYRLIPARQLLLRGDEPLRVGARALDILTSLIEKRGELTSRLELMSSAWPRNVVCDSNLKVHVAALRRILGEGKDGARYIATVNGRGYRFVAPVSSRSFAMHDTASHKEIVLHSPALPLTRLTGREDVIARAWQMLAETRFVSLVGPGGIGKTMVAQAIVQACRGKADAEACFISLDCLPDDQSLPAAVAAALALSVPAGDSLPALLAALRGRRLLLVFDSCDRVIDNAAVLTEQLARHAPDVMVLATCREPLRCAGEHVYRIPPLACPAPETALSAAQALAYPAVQLFAGRAAEHLQSFRLHDSDAAAAGEICRRLDGNPLAIELAATRIEALSVHEICARLDDRAPLLAWTRRGAQRRHNNLSASLDWSYELLNEKQQRLFRSLAVFKTPFTLKDAMALCPDEGIDTIDVISSLVSKSLIAADTGGPVVVYRLLETTRAYALEKLVLTGEMQPAASSRVISWIPRQQRLRRTQ